jgi:NAD kinase
MSIPELHTVGLVPHWERPLAHELARRAARRFLELGIEVRMPAADAAFAGLDELGVDDDTFSHGLDLAISLGGDGTMLRKVSTTRCHGSSRGSSRSRSAWSSKSSSSLLAEPRVVGGR